MTTLQWYTNTPYICDMCAQITYLWGWIWHQSDPLIPPPGWEWCSEVEAGSSIVSASVWRLDIAGMRMYHRSNGTHTHHPCYVFSNHLSVQLDCWLKPNSRIPSSGWEWCSEVDIDSFIVTASVWRLDMVGRIW